MLDLSDMSVQSSVRMESQDEREIKQKLITFTHSHSFCC